ncbi:MAG: beta-CASP ribonuclease aCPSF1 [Thermoprotei archaeon]|nr:MAG: beta-CASP ribonuclease aCPSF1 [Thermoprotei archaeon]
MYSDRLLGTIRTTIVQHIPREAGITKIEFEGPRIVLYCADPIFLMKRADETIKRIAKLIKKRIEVRPDPKVRLNEERAKEIIKKIVPEEAEITDIYFNEETGEVEIEAMKPGYVIGKNAVLRMKIFEATLWRPRILRKPPIESKVVREIRDYFRTKATERRRFLGDVGQKIHRDVFFKEARVRVMALGGFGEVGRSAILVETSESKILLDVGIKPCQGRDEYPYLDAMDCFIDELDAVIVTHAHLDHCGFAPYLFKYGYRGPIYTTEPTLHLMKLLQDDYVDVNIKEGRRPIYSKRDVAECILHTITLNYGEVTDIASDVKLTFHRSGHIIGGAMAHLHIGSGLCNIVYTSDFKFGRTRLLDPAAHVFPRIELLILESTYGAPSDVMPSREETELEFLSIINRTIERKGIVLVPVLAVGRAQEILLVLADAMKRKLIPEVPVFIEGMIGEATAIHTAYPEYLSKSIRDEIYYRENPFKYDVFELIKDPERHLDIVEQKPSIIMATSGMLTGGPALTYLKLLAPDPSNSLIFVSYQVEGTLGRRIQRGLREVVFPTPEGKLEIVRINMEIHSVEGFSGHSDRKQLVGFTQRVEPRPEAIVLNHGEKSKIKNLSNYLRRKFNMQVYELDNLGALRIR